MTTNAFDDMITKSLNETKGTFVKPKTTADIAEELGIEVGEGQVALSSLLGSYGTTMSGLDIPITIFKDSDWADEEIRNCIPANTGEWFEGFDPDMSVLRHVLVSLENNLKLMMHGPSGTGKTAIIKYACALTRRPYIRIQMTGDTMSDSILGSRSVEGTEIVWHDGLLTKAARKGAVLAVDEWEVTPPEIMFAMQEVLEKGGQLTLRDFPSTRLTDKMVAPHKEYRMCFCGNTLGQGDSTGAFAGTTVQNSATINRFQVIVHVGHASVDKYVKVLNDWVPDFNTVYGNPGLDRKLAQLIHDVQQAYRGVGSKSLNVDAGFRTLEIIADLMKSYGDPKIAIQMAIGNKCDEVSKPILSDMFHQLTGQNLDLA